MFCTNCGSPLPEGSKFCVQCGAPVEGPASDEPVSAMMPEVPSVPDPVAPAPLWNPDPTPDPEPKAESAPAPEPEAPSGEPFAAFDAAVQGTPYSAPAAAPAEPAPASQPVPPEERTGGWSLPGGGYTRPGDAPAAPAKRSPAAIWIVLGCLVLVIAAIIAAAFALVRRLPAAMNEVQSAVEEELGGSVSLADLPQDASVEDILAAVESDIDNVTAQAENEIENAEPAKSADTEPAEPAEPDEPAEPADAMTPEEYRAALEEALAEHYADRPDLTWYIEIDEDYKDGEFWADAYLWEPDTLDRALAAYDGDEEQLAAWNEEMEDLRSFSWDLQDILYENGRPDSVACLNVVDQEDYEYLLAFAVDGELLLDQVNGVDEWGLFEETEDAGDAGE